MATTTENPNEPPTTPTTRKNAKPAKAQKPVKARKGAKKTARKTRSRTKVKAAVRGVQISAEQLPRKTLEQALRIPRTLREVFAGGPTKWPDLAKASGLSLSQSNKYYVWAAQAYGVVEKDEDQFSITETGRRILAPTKPGEDKEAIRKAVLTPILFSRFFTDYNGSPFPSDEHIGNVLEVRYSIPRDRTEEAKAQLKENGIFAGILETRADGSLFVRLDPSLPVQRQSSEIETGADSESVSPRSVTGSLNYETMCFIITPIGDHDSVERRHADVILKSVIEPVMKEFDLAPRRADQIDRSGIITQQIFECIANAKLCVADLSFSNPNAFYELGIRHMCKLPTIQLIRRGDKIPFDVSQGRTIRIDMTDVYTVVESIESAKRELREHVKHAVSPDFKGDDNPVNVYLPGLEVRFPR